ncbi:MAG: protein kinase [Pyrinomonadaceae bacterium]
MPFCPECGASVAPKNPFCGNCGMPQQTDASEEASMAAAAPASQASSAPEQESSAYASSSSAPESTASSPGFSSTLTDAVPAAESEAEVNKPTYRKEEATLTDAPRVLTFGETGERDAVAATEEPVEHEESPVYQAPVHDAPVHEALVHEPPIHEAPVHEAPAVQAAPSLEDSSYGLSVSDESLFGVKTFSPEDAPPPDEDAPAATAHVRAEGTGGRKSQMKQLDPGAVLINRYEVVRRIGGGGMGAVYLAKDHNLGDAPRAVKEMIESHIDASQHDKAINDFKRESLLLTSLEHPSIPTIYDYFYDSDAGRFYLVMKYISGGDLAARQRSAPGGRIDEKTVADWAAQIADVLDYLHNRPKPIIYRDLKPANIMIDGNTGRVMLIDFGIARWVSAQDTKGVTAVGTMGYAPPELFSGKVEPASDVYSLAATMFHLLTGSDPQDNPLLIFDFTKNPRPRQINPAISNEMERILMRAVEYKTENRFRSAAEMRAALMAHLDRLRIGDVSYGGVSGPQASPETIQVETVFCGFCGGRIAADDQFCAHCGARQPLTGVGASSALRAARATAKLVVAGTTELDASFLLQKDNNLVGRTDPHSNIFPEVDLSKFDPETKVSRRHARIWREGDQFLVEDLGSVNGTVVLGRGGDQVRLAPRQPRALENGDKLRLGETTLHFLVG